MIIIPSKWKCNKGHRLFYYHRAGVEWCLACLQKKHTSTGHHGKNYYRWPILSMIDDCLPKIGYDSMLIQLYIRTVGNL